MRKLTSSFLTVFVFILLCVPALADTQADEILKQARAAICGEDQIQKIQGINLVGQYRRVFGDRQMAGDREISILLPNKYSVEDSMNPGGLSTAMINTRTLNGEKAWNATSGGG